MSKRRHVSIGTGRQPGRLADFVIIRDARPGELDMVGELRITAYRHGGHLSADSEYAQVLRTLGADGHGDVIVAEADGKVIGTVMVQYPPHAGHHVGQEAGEAEIRALAVAPGGQGRGIGQALVEAAITRATGRGVRHLVLWTDPDMVTAHRLYRRTGFRRLPERDWSPNGQVTVLAYSLPLPEQAATGPKAFGCMFEGEAIKP